VSDPARPPEDGPRLALPVFLVGLAGGILAILVSVVAAVVILLGGSDTRTYDVPGPGMAPAVTGRTVEVDVDAYGDHAPRRGDVVLARATPAARASCREVRVLLRVVGIGGDRVAVRADGATVVNGRPLAIPGVRGGGRAATFPPVPAGRLLLVGDDRSVACDARRWGADPFVPVGAVIGRVEAGT
jgi:signal peptidase I